MTDFNINEIEDSVDIADLLQVIIDNIKYIALATICIGIFSAIYISTVERTYVALTLVKSAAKVGSTGESSASGLAGLLGIQSSATLSPSMTDIDSTMAIMYSRPFLESFIDKHDLLKVIFSDDWNDETKTWKDGEPTLTDGFDVLKKSITITFDPIAWTRRQVGYAEIEVDWSNAKTAAYIANNLVIDINIFLSKKMIDESNLSIAFLDEQWLKTNVLSVRESLSKLKTEQIRNMMLANSTKDFALTVINDALPPEFPTSPKRGQFVIIATALGFVVSILLIFLKDSLTPILRELKLPF